MQPNSSGPQNARVRFPFFSFPLLGLFEALVAFPLLWFLLQGLAWHFFFCPWTGDLPLLAL